MICVIKIIFILLTIIIAEYKSYNASVISCTQGVNLYINQFLYVMIQVLVFTVITLLPFISSKESYLPNNSQIYFQAVILFIFVLNL